MSTKQPKPSLRSGFGCFVDTCFTICQYSLDSGYTTSVDGTVDKYRQTTTSFKPPSAQTEASRMGGGSTSADVSRKITSAIEYKYFPIEEISAQVYAKMASIIQQTEEYFLNGILDIIDLGAIGEALYYEYVKIKICQRLSLGWNEIYSDPHLSKSRERMVYPFTFPHQINQALLLIYDSITPQPLRQEILRLFDQYSPENENVLDYLGWGYDEERFDEDVDDDGPPLRLFWNLHLIFQDEINNDAYKCAPVA